MIALIDKSPPSTATIVPQRDTEVVTHARRIVAFGVAKPKANGVVILPFCRPAPFIAEFITQPDKVAVPESAQDSPTLAALEPKLAASNE